MVILAWISLDYLKILKIDHLRPSLVGGSCFLGQERAYAASGGERRSLQPRRESARRGVQGGGPLAEAAPQDDAASARELLVLAGPEARSAHNIL